MRNSTDLFKIKRSCSRSNICPDSLPSKKRITLYCSYGQTLSKLWHKFVISELVGFVAFSIPRAFPFPRATCPMYLQDLKHECNSVFLLFWGCVGTDFGIFHGCAKSVLKTLIIARKKQERTKAFCYLKYIYIYFVSLPAPHLTPDTSTCVMSVDLKSVNSC